MHLQELEELQFYPQSEAQMCFEEAGSYMRAVKPLFHGEGEFRVRVLSPYYCRSTDAFVGMVCYTAFDFKTKEEAFEFMEMEHEADPELQFETNFSK